MTEEEWLTATDPATMLALVSGRASGRKLRLMAVASARRVWPLLKYEESRRAVLVAERFADAQADPGELDVARRQSDILKTAGLGGTTTFPAARAAHACTDRRPTAAAATAGEYARAAGNLRRERAAQAAYVRCLLGVPRRPVALDPSWLTSTVVALAPPIYADRLFDRLPILADALQDAGCEDADILNHCRGPGPHARGCWVVDLVLGKA